MRVIRSYVTGLIRYTRVDEDGEKDTVYIDEKKCLKKKKKCVNNKNKNETEKWNTDD